jgi:hypothetical protein
MGISAGGIDFSNEIVELHYQMRRTQKILEILLSKSPQLGQLLTSDDLVLSDNDALDFVKRKFPDMGIQRK